MSEALSALAKDFFQVAYVVPDISAAESWFQRVMGVRQFLRLDNVTLAEGCSYRGKPADSAMHIALGYLGDVQIELIESIRGPSIYDEFLEQKGGGLHHLGFSVPDFAGTLAELRGSGLEVIAEGSLMGGTRFAYFDCEAAGVSVVEILGFDAATLALMEQIKRSSAPAPNEG